LFISNIPYPGSTITNHNGLSGGVHTPPHGFPVHSLTKYFRRFNRTGIAGGHIIPHRAAFIINTGLGKDASQLGFPGLGLDGKDQGHQNMIPEK